MPRLFGYGSLISRESATATCQRSIEPDQHVDAILVGYERIWQLVVPVLVGESYDQLLEGVFLDITPAAAAPCVGSMFAVTADELSYFDRRERQYERVDVTAKIFPPVKNDKVYTYIGHPQFTNPGSDSVVFTRYEKIVNDALTEKPACFQALWQASTRPHKFKRADDLYRFASVEQQDHSGR